MLCRIHCQTAGVALAAQQPYNNVVRVALQALAAVLGGTQSLHTNSLDETLALPTERSATLALRTQQIIAYESGVAQVADPLAGSYFVETLTNEIERACLDYFERIDAMGGMVEAIERGFPQREIGEASYRFQQALDRREKIIVGVNAFQSEEEHSVETLVISDDVHERQCAQLRRLRSERDGERVNQALAGLRHAAAGPGNLMAPILECARAYATLGEMCDTLRAVFGEYREPPFD
jgi:methylmalonyl-CoA mutase N-terminal domain/subunit